MPQLLIVFVHLIATCMAIGVIVTTDMRLLAKLVGYRVVIPAPERFETLMIIVAMTTLVLSGLALVMIGLQADPDYLKNPKLQAKIVLVALLVANAFALHYVTFPRLAKAVPVASWNARDHLSVALPVALSNSLWMYCAFLGIARPWNNRMSMLEVLVIAAVLFVVVCFVVLVTLQVAARDEPENRPDWIDSVKARLSERLPLGERPPYQDTLF